MSRIVLQCGVVAVVCSLGLSSGRAQQVQVTKDNRTLFVSAAGNASAEADAATVHIGFQIYGPNSETAYARGSKVSNEIAAALSQAGVPKGAIESDTQSIAEAQPYELNHLSPAERADRAFRLQQSWTVKTSGKNANQVLDIAIKAGANASGQIDWRMADPDALHAKAVEDAMARAKRNAENIASGMSVKLGSLIYASNDRPAGRDRLEQYAMLQGASVGNPALKQVIPIAVSPRRIEDSAIIYAIYAIQ